METRGGGSRKKGGRKGSRRVMERGDWEVIERK